MPNAPSADKIGLGLLLGLIGVVFFGGTLPFTRLAVADMSPSFVTYGRAVVAATLAFGLLLVMKRSPFTRKHFAPLFLSGLCLIIGFPFFMALAMQTVPASHGGIVLGILPILTALFSTFLNKERPSRLFWILSVAGCVLVVGFALGDGAVEFGLGDIWLFVGALFVSLGYAISGGVAREMPGWEVISRGLVLCLPISLLGAFLAFPSNIGAIPPLAWTGFAYVSLFSMFIGFMFWNAGLALGGVAFVGQTQLLQIFVTLALSQAILGEVVDSEAWIVASLIVCIIFFMKKSR